LIELADPCFGAMRPISPDRNGAARFRFCAVDAGDAIVFPTARGHCINPYFRSKEAIVGGWRQDGWGAAVIVECGRDNASAIIRQMSRLTDNILKNVFLESPEHWARSILTG
jgi:hypothetical protein